MRRSLLSFVFFTLTASLFAQETKDQSPKPSSRRTLSPGYNAPDRIAVRSSWSLYTDVSFLYWMPMEDNLEPAIRLSSSDITASKGTVIDFDFQYKPAFKVAMGFETEYDNWDFFAEYTRLRSFMKTNSSTNTGQSLSPILLMPQITGDTTYSFVDEKWRLTLDFLDIALSRSYFSGEHLTFCYFYGARGAWIYQNLSQQFSNPTAIVNSSSTTYSWAAGPRVGLNGHWNATQKGRLYGNGAADLLFTRYDARREESSNSNPGYRFREGSINTLRAHLELELGIGWGSHFWDNKWHFDLSAGYGFQVFFNQNMFRAFYNSDSFAGESPCGNLYIQGLNVTARFDF